MSSSAPALHPLSALLLRFECEATTPLRLDVAGYRAGNFLRGALGSVMRRAYCEQAALAARHRGPSDDADAHAAVCPVCWLLARNERPGQERRGYALRPPLAAPVEAGYAPGERFEFGITLFGNTTKFLPYFVLAVPEAGRLGVGAGRGQFAVKSVWAENPLTEARECLLAEGEAYLRLPTVQVGLGEAPAPAQLSLGAEAAEASARVKVQLNFQTPLRLIEGGGLLKSPDFGVLFARLLDRLDVLRAQFGDGQRRPLAEVQALQALADRVRLVQTDTRWVEVRSESSRTGQATWLSGLVGTALYIAPAEAWRPLWPWLLAGQVTQVGKDTVKGNGVYEVQVDR